MSISFLCAQLRVLESLFDGRQRENLDRGADCREISGLKAARSDLLAYLITYPIQLQYLNEDSTSQS
jgi:hypothetical protein